MLDYTKEIDIIGVNGANNVCLKSIGTDVEYQADGALYSRIIQLFKQHKLVAKNIAANTDYASKLTIMRLIVPDIKLSVAKEKELLKAKEDITLMINEDAALSNICGFDLKKFN